MQTRMHWKIAMRHAKIEAKEQTSENSDSKPGSASMPGSNGMLGSDGAPASAVSSGVPGSAGSAVALPLQSHHKQRIGKSLQDLLSETTSSR